MSPPTRRPGSSGAATASTSPSASGGMGIVWRANDELLGRPVAVKEVRFPPELGEQEQEELRKRTLREARATASLSHPNVVTTYDVVEEDGRPYIVMELLRGRSLSDLLREDGPLPPTGGPDRARDARRPRAAHRRACAPRRQARQRAAHHDGRAVLTDFGIATMAGDPALTSTGVVLGSPAYMSPERARGKQARPRGRPVVARRHAVLRGRRDGRRTTRRTRSAR